MTKEEVLPLVLPAGWEVIEERADGRKYLKQTPVGLLCVIAGVERHRDKKHWLHVSLSYQNSLPSWDTVKLVKDTFIGPKKTALQVLPPDSDYVNIHPYCLHLWHCLDGDVTPDFTQGSKMI